MGRFESETTAPENLDGERKTYSALFADIKGSMDLIEDLDPQQARAIVDATLKLMMERVQRYGGVCRPIYRRWHLRPVRRAHCVRRPSPARLRKGVRFSGADPLIVQHTTNLSSAAMIRFAPANVLFYATA